MFNAWVLDIITQPPEVVAHVEAEKETTFFTSVGVLKETFSEPQFTIVVEIGLLGEVELDSTRGQRKHV